MTAIEDFVPAGSRVRFEQRPTAVPGDLRISWRLAVVSLMLRWSRAKKASLSKLHVLNSSLRSSETQRLLISVINGNEPPMLFPLMVEPALGRALDLSRAEGLVGIAGPGTFVLTARGQNLADAVESLDETLPLEQQFLSSVAPRLTETIVQTLLGVRR